MKRPRHLGTRLMGREILPCNAAERATGLAMAHQGEGVRQNGGNHNSTLPPFYPPFCSFAVDYTFFYNIDHILVPPFLILNHRFMPR